MPESPVDPEQLSSVPESDDDARNDVLDSDVDDDILTDVSAAASAVSLDMTNVSIELTDISSPNAQRAAQAPPLLIPPGSSIPASDSLSSAEKALTKVIEAEISPTPPERLWFNRSTFWGTSFSGGTMVFSGISALGSLIAIIASLYAVITAKAHGTNDSAPIPESAQDSFDQMAEQWLKIEPNRYWSLVSAYCIKNQPVISFQLLMMSDTIMLSRPANDANGNTWKWQNGDAEAYTKNLTDAFYNTVGDIGTQSAAMYTELQTFTYDGYGTGATTLPIAVGAGLILYAIGNLLTGTSTT